MKNTTPLNKIYLNMKVTDVDPVEPYTSLYLIPHLPENLKIRFKLFKNTFTTITKITQYGLKYKVKNNN